MAFIQFLLLKLFSLMFILAQVGNRFLAHVNRPRGSGRQFRWYLVSCRLLMAVLLSPPSKCRRPTFSALLTIDRCSSYSDASSARYARVHTVRNRTRRTDASRQTRANCIGKRAADNQWDVRPTRRVSQARRRITIVSPDDVGDRSEVECVGRGLGHCNACCCRCGVQL